MEEKKKKLEEIEKILEKIKEEETQRKLAIEKEIEERRKAKEKMRNEKEKREEERRREKVRRKERLATHQRLQNAWETLRWITAFIEENAEVWEIEKMEREEERRRKVLEWEKSQRIEKIAFLRAREKRKREGLIEENDVEMNKTWVWEEWRRDNPNQNTDYDKEEKIDEVIWPTGEIRYNFNLKSPTLELPNREKINPELRENITRENECGKNKAEPEIGAECGRENNGKLSARIENTSRETEPKISTDNLKKCEELSEKIECGNKRAEPKISTEHSRKKNAELSDEKCVETEKRKREAEPSMGAECGRKENAELKNEKPKLENECGTIENEPKMSTECELSPKLKEIKSVAECGEIEKNEELQYECGQNKPTKSAKTECGEILGVAKPGLKPECGKVGVKELKTKFEKGMGQKKMVTLNSLNVAKKVSKSHQQIKSDQQKKKSQKKIEKKENKPPRNKPPKPPPKSKNPNKKEVNQKSKIKEKIETKIQKNPQDIRKYFLAFNQITTQERKTSDSATPHKKLFLNTSPSKKLIFSKKENSIFGIKQIETKTKEDKNLFKIKNSHNFTPWKKILAAPTEDRPQEKLIKNENATKKEKKNLVQEKINIFEKPTKSKADLTLGGVFGIRGLEDRPKNSTFFKNSITEPYLRSGTPAKTSFLGPHGKFNKRQSANRGGEVGVRRFSEIIPMKMEIVDDSEEEKGEGGGKKVKKRRRMEDGEEEKVWRDRREEKTRDRMFVRSKEKIKESLFTSVNKENKTQIGAWWRQEELLQARAKAKDIKPQNTLDSTVGNKPN